MKRFEKRHALLLCWLLIAPALAGCVSMQEEESEYDYETSNVYDPLEPFNRCVSEFNYTVDGLLIKPLAQMYRQALPKPVRKGVRNVLRNLSSPVLVFNSAVQGDAEQAFTAFWRFTLNSTLGVGGIFDFAGQYGLKHRDEDFGQTMAVHGAETGPYLVLPLLGPSNARDAFGRLVDVFIDPFNYVDHEVVTARTVVRVIDGREEALDATEELERNALDLYSTTRSAYNQYRENLIRNGADAE